MPPKANGSQYYSQYSFTVFHLEVRGDLEAYPIHPFVGGVVCGEKQRARQSTIVRDDIVSKDFYTVCVCVEMSDR